MGVTVSIDRVDDKKQEVASGIINFLFINTCSPVPPRPSDIILDFRFEYLIIYV